MTICPLPCERHAGRRGYISAPLMLASCRPCHYGQKLWEPLGVSSRSHSSLYYKNSKLQTGAALSAWVPECKDTGSRVPANPWSPNWNLSDMVIGDTCHSSSKFHVTKWWYCKPLWSGGVFVTGVITEQRLINTLTFVPSWTMISTDKLLWMTFFKRPSMSTLKSTPPWVHGFGKHASVWGRK